MNYISLKIFLPNSNIFFHPWFFQFVVWSGPKWRYFTERESAFDWCDDLSFVLDRKDLIDSFILSHLLLFWNFGISSFFCVKQLFLLQKLHCKWWEKLKITVIPGLHLWMLKNSIWYNDFIIYFLIYFYFSAYDDKWISESRFSNLLCWKTTSWLGRSEARSFRISIACFLCFVSTCARGILWISSKYYAKLID